MLYPTERFLDVSDSFLNGNVTFPLSVSRVLSPSVNVRFADMKSPSNGSGSSVNSLKKLISNPETSESPVLTKVSSSLKLYY